MELIAFYLTFNQGSQIGGFHVTQVSLIITQSEK